MKRKVLILGGGGREYALGWSLLGDDVKLYAAPGNAGMAEYGAECFPDLNADDIPGVLTFCDKIRPDIILPGPEAPLVAGITNHARFRGFQVCGPMQHAAFLTEGSKSACMRSLEMFGVPIPRYQVIDNVQVAREFAINHFPMTRVAKPLVIKADGLCGGKGVFIAANLDEAVCAVDRIMVKKEFGIAGDVIVMQEFLEGTEATFTIMAKGRTYVTLTTAKDFKRAFDGDKGENTGGMGVVSPNPDCTPWLCALVDHMIIRPTVEGLASMGHPYYGFLYFGLMMTKDGAKVLELNCRLGDPEAQAILARADFSLLGLIDACKNGGLESFPLKWLDHAAVGVVAADGNYPGTPTKGLAISGIEDAEKLGAIVFQAGVRGNPPATDGGRVLLALGLKDTYAEARDLAYAALGKIHFEGIRYRSDIAAGL